MICNTCEIEMVPLTADLHICNECTLISSDLSADLSLYDKSYLRKYERYQNTALGVDINSLRADIVVGCDVKHKSILDFGCGSGAFVSECKSRRLSVQGFDINPNSIYCDVANLLNGHKVVTFWDSLEHLPDPKTVLTGLKPEMVFIGTPSTDDFTGDIRKLTEWHHYYPGEHVHYYNEISLRHFLKECGYTVVVETYGESECRTSGFGKNILTMGGIRG